MAHSKPIENMLAISEKELKVHDMINYLKKHYIPLDYYFQKVKPSSRKGHSTKRHLGDQPVMNIAFVGDSNNGKSSFLKTLFYALDCPHVARQIDIANEDGTRTTIGMDGWYIGSDTQNIKIWDTQGTTSMSTEYKKLWSYISGCEETFFGTVDSVVKGQWERKQVVVVTVRLDITPNEYDSIKEAVALFKKNFTAHVMLLITKCDTIGDGVPDPVSLMKSLGFTQDNTVQMINNHNKDGKYERNKEFEDASIRVLWKIIQRGEENYKHLGVFSILDWFSFVRCDYRILLYVTVVIFLLGLVLFK